MNAIGATTATLLLTAAGMGLAQPGFAKGGPKADTNGIVEAYEARHGAWMLRCDPCASYEESVCTLWSRSGPGNLSIFPVDESDPKPQLAMTYAPQRALAFETEGTLNVMVDNGPERTFTAPDVAYMAMYGDLYIEADAVTTLLADFRSGTMATLTFTDDDGGAPEQVSLDGFASSLDDMLARLPFPRRPFDDSRPDSCPY